MKEKESKLRKNKKKETLLIQKEATKAIARIYLKKIKVISNEKRNKGQNIRNFTYPQSHKDEAAS